MMETAAEQLDLLLILGGLLVWGGLLVSRLGGGRPLRISPYPRVEAIGFGSELVFAALLTFLLVGQLGISVLEHLGGGLNTLSRQLLADLAGKLAAVVLMAVVLARRLRMTELFAPNHSRSVGFLLLISIAVYLALYPLVNVLLLSGGVYVFSILERWFGFFVPQNHQAFELLNDQTLPAGVRVTALVLAGVVSPMVEEVFFRGVVQNALYRFFRRPVPAIVLAGAFFALVHLPLYSQLPALWMLGIVLGWSYYRFGSLAAAIMIHVLFNTMSLVLWRLGGI